MKKLVLFMFLLSFSRVSAQGQWIPTDGGITAPIDYKVYVWNHCNGTNYDTTFYGYSEAGVLVKKSSIINYYSIADTFSISGYDPQTGYQMHVSFILDTLSRTLRNLSIDTSNNNFRASGETEITYSELPYTLVNDSTITGSENGSESVKKMTVNQSRNSYTYPCGGGSYGTTSTFNAITSDTIIFSCSITLVFRKNTSSVQSLNPTRMQLSASFSLDGERIRLNFPMTTTAATLALYDLVGRCILHENIPPGATVYTLLSSALPSGCYIAHLGNMTTKFVVY
jgi:hypothetical protein